MESANRITKMDVHVLCCFKHDPNYMNNVIFITIFQTHNAREVFSRFSANDYYDPAVRIIHFSQVDFQCISSIAQNSSVACFSPAFCFKLAQGWFYVLLRNVRIVISAIYTNKYCSLM